MNNDDTAAHKPGEATPQEVKAPIETAPTSEFGLHDADWKDGEWKGLLEALIERGMATWKDVTALVLGHLNPSQFGTSLASSDGFKRKYGKGNTMKVVMEWAYRQTGRCADCGTRLELQADHVEGREQFKDPLEADFIENMTFRCRRCNVVRRPSHEFGGLTHLTAQAALMWILFVIRPRTLKDFTRMCRMYGMTMADIRMQEAWAMAHWLARDDPPAFGIEDDENGTYDIALWKDGAISRVDVGHDLPDGAKRLYASVPGKSILGFIVEAGGGRPKLYEHPISFIPFSTYDLGNRPLQSLALHYVAPDRENKERGSLAMLAPRGMKLLWHGIREPEQCFQFTSASEPISRTTLPEAPTYGKLLKILDTGKIETVQRK